MISSVNVSLYCSVCCVEVVRGVRNVCVERPSHFVTSWRDVYDKGTLCEHRI